MDTQIAIRNDYMPAITTAEAVQRWNALVDFVKQVMKPGVDFGVIPGTGNKPTLLKPGAEKLCTLFGLRTQFTPVKTVEDWDKGFFYFHYRCDLVRGGEVIASGEGSCNTKEKKYRWRQQDRLCPACGKPAIIKGKEEYGGGYICFAKKGGCGAKYADNDLAITGQAVGQVENTETFDLVNTIQKMAQKRAFVAATLVGVNASEFFTQDIEDMTIEGTFVEVPPAVPAKNGNGHKPAEMTLEAAAEMKTAKGSRLGDMTSDQLVIVNEKATDETLRRASSLLIDALIKRQSPEPAAA